MEVQIKATGVAQAVGNGKDAARERQGPLARCGMAGADTNQSCVRNPTGFAAEKLARPHDDRGAVLYATAAVGWLGGWVLVGPAGGRCRELELLAWAEEHGEHWSAAGGWLERDGMGWDGMGWDWDGMGWDGTG